MPLAIEAPRQQRTMEDSQEPFRLELSNFLTKSLKAFLNKVENCTPVPSENTQTQFPAPELGNTFLNSGDCGVGINKIVINTIQTFVGNISDAAILARIKKLTSTCLTHTEFETLSNHVRVAMRVSILTSAGNPCVYADDEDLFVLFWKRESKSVTLSFAKEGGNFTQMLAWLDKNRGSTQENANEDDLRNKLSWLNQ